MLRQVIRSAVYDTARRLSDAADFNFSVDASQRAEHGDYATNAALVLANRSGKSPLDVAKSLAENLKNQNGGTIAIVEARGAGFVNIRLRDDFLVTSLREALSAGMRWGEGAVYAGGEVLVEFTDPNPFKQFHIGHLMSNAIGEAMARLFEAGGATVRRLNYQGDVGVHVACAVWGMQRRALPNDDVSLAEKIKYLGTVYAEGAAAYRDDPAAKVEIDRINKKLYERADPELNQAYDLGRRWSLEHFEIIYRVLGTKFSGYFFESEAGPVGLEIVRAHPDVFRESDGAIIFPGGDYGLHNRVFVNSQGLPTYEAKELGLNKLKFDRYPAATRSIIITANEIREYFHVVLKAMSLVLPEIAAKTEHVSHGFLRLPSGKMSSRTGEVIAAESLISEVRRMVEEKLRERPELAAADRTRITELVAIGAIKLSILKQGIGRDIIFDFEKSIALQGDSGPYLQYTHARLKSILRKAAKGTKGTDDPKGVVLDDVEHQLLVKALQLPEAIEDALKSYAPNTVANYLLHLAQLANEFYHSRPVIQEADEIKRQLRLRIVEAVALSLRKGLDLLGIEAPEEM